MGMVATAEIPILTPRTLDLLREAIPADTHRVLRDSLHRIRPLFAAFLAEVDGEADEAFLIASSRYAHPRLHALLLLASVLEPRQLISMIEQVSNHATDLLQREGWRLQDGLNALEPAWDTYAEIGRLMTQRFSSLGDVRHLPYGLLMASTKMDFTLTATAMYLEGDFPAANPARLRFLCYAAEAETRNVKSVITEGFFPSTSYANLKVLRRLCGSWQDDDRLDEDLKTIYESRRYRTDGPL